ncbi:MAG: tRNA 2-thiouridine(34) synthase MnmA, partial [Patescibacteria group bacterium]
GHYAKLKSVVKNAKPAFKLFAAKDDKKDQSYFLVGLKQRQLNKIIFPLGDYLKKEVYDLAIKKLCHIGKANLLIFVLLMIINNF